MINNQTPGHYFQAGNPKIPDKKACSSWLSEVSKPYLSQVPKGSCIMEFMN